MKITPKDLLELKVIEKIIEEKPLDFYSLEENIYDKFTKLKQKEVNTLLSNRYNRFRKFGSLL